MSFGKPFRPGWENWRRPILNANEDTFKTDFQESGYAAESGAATPQKWIFSSDSYTAVAIRMFGTAAENKVADVQISGWVDPNQQGGRGPGQVLWQGRVSLGPHSMATSAPLPSWGSGTWLEVNKYDPGVFGAAAGSNPAGARMYGGGGGAILVLPTLGYTRLLMEINLPGADQVTSIGAIAKGVGVSGILESLIGQELGGHKLTTVSGRTALTTGSTAQRISATHQLFESVTVHSLATNAGDMYAGDSAVDEAAGAEQGEPMEPGDATIFPGPVDLYDLYFVSATTGDVILWSGVVRSE